MKPSVLIISLSEPELSFLDLGRRFRIKRVKAIGKNNQKLKNEV